MVSSAFSFSKKSGLFFHTIIYSSSFTIRIAEYSKFWVCRTILQTSRTTMQYCSAIMMYCRAAMQYCIFNFAVLQNNIAVLRSRFPVLQSSSAVQHYGSVLVQNRVLVQLNSFVINEIRKIERKLRFLIEFTQTKEGFRMTTFGDIEEGKRKTKPVIQSEAKNLINNIT